MKSLICNNIKITFRESGIASGSVMIFLHNGGTDHSIWDPINEYFATQYRIYAIDWPGFGQSEENQHAHNLQAYSHVLKDFIEQLKLKNITLIGTCLGSSATLAYCQMVRGSNIRSLILFNVLSPSTLSSPVKMIIRSKRNKNFNTLSHWIENKLCQYKIGRDLLINYQFNNSKAVRKNSRQHLANLYRNSSNARSLNALGQSITSFEQLDTLEKPDWFPPTMVIWGKQNNVLPYRNGKAFMSHFKPDIELALEGGHLLMMENAKGSAHHIKKFMEKSAELSHHHHQFA
ncbi:MAG: hypothetical protein COA99_04395 [Moraxellaceae bacterium]|nr:MAG: hypothetical protein COA99_04395 [Moraxellaceae bacterium]